MADGKQIAAKGKEAKADDTKTGSKLKSGFGGPFFGHFQPPEFDISSLEMNLQAKCQHNRSAWPTGSKLPQSARKPKRTTRRQDRS